MTEDDDLRYQRRGDGLAMHVRNAMWTAREGMGQWMNGRPRATWRRLAAL